MINVIELYKKYDKASRYALENVSFDMVEGELLGLIGENGAGKSTLLKAMCKFIKPTKGKILLNGQDINDKDKVLKDVGILFEPVFYPQLTAYENLSFYLDIHGKKSYKNQIKGLLEMVGLEKSINDKPKDFSFGMKQRLGLAQALLGDPKVLILDEPFVGLDPTGVKELILILKDRVKENNIKAIISSHQLHELSEVCERMLVINHGKLVFDGIPDLNPEITFILDRDYCGEVEDGMIIKSHGNTVATNLTGEGLNELVRHLIQHYNIINIDSKKSALEHFFQEE